MAELGQRLLQRLAQRLRGHRVLVDAVAGAGADRLRGEAIVALAGNDDHRRQVHEAGGAPQEGRGRLPPAASSRGSSRSAPSASSSSRQSARRAGGEHLEAGALVLAQQPPNDRDVVRVVVDQQDPYLITAASPLASSAGRGRRATSNQYLSTAPRPRRSPRRRPASGCSCLRPARSSCARPLRGPRR